MAFVTVVIACNLDLICFVRLLSHLCNVGKAVSDRIEDGIALVAIRLRDECLVVDAVQVDVLGIVSHFNGVGHLESDDVLFDRVASVSIEDKLARKNRSGSMDSVSAAQMIM